MNKNLKTMDDAEWKEIPYYTDWTVIDRFSKEVLFQSPDVNEASSYANNVLAANEDAPIVLTKQRFCLVRHYSAQMGDPDDIDSFSWSPEQMCWQIVHDSTNEEQRKCYEDYDMIERSKSSLPEIPW